MSEVDTSTGAVERRVAHLRFVYGADNQDAAMLEALLAQLAEAQAEVGRRVDMHECAMAERDDATLYGVEQKARADRAEEDIKAMERLKENYATMKDQAKATVSAQPSPDVAALVEAAVKAERDRIIDALRDEADMRPCDEDAVVVRDCADLIEVHFSYEDAERLKEARLKGGAA